MEDIGEREKEEYIFSFFASSAKYINLFSTCHLKKKINNTPLHSVGTEMMHYARKRE
jgi:hypothetical protein